jgi:hypothetical protein
MAAALPSAVPTSNPINAGTPISTWASPIRVLKKV